MKNLLKFKTKKTERIIENRNIHTHTQTSTRSSTRKKIWSTPTVSRRRILCKVLNFIHNLCINWSVVYLNFMNIDALCHLYIGMCRDMPFSMCKSMNGMEPFIALIWSNKREINNVLCLAIRSNFAFLVC